MPAALQTLRLRIAVTVGGPASTVAAALEAMGYRRVPTVTEVAEFSVRGGILDVYGFGMATPARLEWWGDDISSIRGFDLTTQRSLEELTEVTVLPVSTDAVRQEPTDGRSDGQGVRRTLLELLPADTLVVEEAAGPDADEVVRAWNEAEHHLEVARRLGEEVPSAAPFWRSRNHGGRASQRSRGCCSGTSGWISRSDFCAGEGGSRPQPAPRSPRRISSTLILCDNEGQLERMEELLDEGSRAADVRRSPSAHWTADS